jgi:methylenetetrahydrofolate reductase (NADPH)
MRISDAFRAGRPYFSFEFFPPRNEAGAEALFATIDALRSLEPAYVSVTYGAGGSTRDRTIELAKRIRNEIGLEVMVHVTCVNNTRDDLRRLFDELRDAGFENVMALRGDPPKGQARFEKVEGGFSYASELIAMLSNEYDFCVGGAAYPQVHPEASDAQSDLRALIAKVEAGADVLVTQIFFDNADYFDFVARARAAGITVPIVPAIMPITSYEQIATITRLSGRPLPARLQAELEDRVDQPEGIAELGTSYATLQCAELIERGAPGVHFITFNKSPATRAIVSALFAAGVWTARDPISIG